MTNIDKLRTEGEARRQASAAWRPTRYGEAINRYLGATGCPDAYSITPGATGPRTFTADTGSRGTSGFVLVGVDEDPISCMAVDHAAIEAELHGWALHLVNVRRGGADAGERLLGRLTDRAHAGTRSTPVTSRLVTGPDPARALLAAAADADLVVVGHRHGAATTALGRSVADRVGRQHTGPVLVVRMPARPGLVEWRAHPIVVAADSSAPSGAAVEFALAEAHVRGCDVTMLHLAGDGTHLAHRLETRSDVAVHHRIISGDPVRALVEASGRAGAVVIGRHGHGVRPGPLLTACAHVLPQRALCPVFLVG